MGLNPESPLPLYRQLADRLLAEVRSGQYSAGQQIPSEHELAAQFGVGRPTVRQATDLLIRRGVLQRRRGAGTFVLSSPAEVDVFSLAGTIASFEAKGLHLTTTLLDRLRRETVVEGSENPFGGREVFFFSRLGRVGPQPVLIEDIFLDPTLFPGIEHVQLTGQSLAQIVQERYFLRPSGGRQTFRVGFLVGKKASALEISQKTPVLVVKRILDFPGARASLYSELFCRTDQFVFSQALGADAHA